MSLSRSLLIPKSTRLRPFSHAAAAALLDPAAPAAADAAAAAPLEYLEGLPRPDPKHAAPIAAVPRESSGKGAAARERRAGRLPSIVFEQEGGERGGNKRLISVQSNQIRNLVSNLGRSFFLSRLFDLEVRSDFCSDADLVEKVRVLPRLDKEDEKVVGAQNKFPEKSRNCRNTYHRKKPMKIDE